MNRKCKTVSLIAFVALLSAGPAFTQSPSDEEISTPTVTPAPVAYVYVQVAKGVNVYDAASNGKLTLVKGSPFAVSGQMEDINGKYLVSVGTTNVHVYAIEANGGVGKQVSVTNTANYGGSECGSTTDAGSFLDHTGKYLYVQLDNGGGGNCAAWQSYLVEPNGSLKFLGDILYYNFVGDSLQWSNVPTVSSNDNLEYASIGSSQGYYEFAAFKKLPNGQMDPNGSFFHNDPIAEDGGSYVPLLMSADPTGHLGVLVQQVDQYGDPRFYQLASYTIEPSSGGITSTNEYFNMPYFTIGASASMSMSPAGNLLALGGEFGIEVYHFNGAAPPTPFTGVKLSSDDFYLSAWDRSNHLYAVSGSYNYANVFTSYAHVFTVTPTTFYENPGSPYYLPQPYGTRGLIVVPKT